ncbi:MAG: serine/threonine protein kinase [Anaerolineae bacterium]|nr:serine/threonine protein kinase [Anaerolineae bacterium]
MSGLAGSTLGPYQILDEIGRGGMADVYRAIQPSIGREVAIKILPAYFLQDRIFVERFTREVQVIASLQHPHILPVYDFGEEDGLPYIVMAYMTGGTLAERIRREGGLPLGEVVRLVEQIASGLDFAHEKGIIHRDFKPSNVLLDEKGNVYLADFGIAKIAQDTAHLTDSGMVGTPTYMAPELTQKGGMTPLVDVYALGVTLFELLTGRHAYQAETPVGILMAHINSPIPDVRVYRPSLADAVQRVVERAMAKDPYQRIQSPGSLATELKRAVEETNKSGFQDTARLSRTPALPVESIPFVPPPDSQIYDSSGSVRISQPKRHRGMRSWFWVGGVVIAAGAVIGILVILFALWGTSGYWSGTVDDTPIPPMVMEISPATTDILTADIGEVSSPTPTMVEANDPNCPGALAPRMQIGGKGRVSLTEDSSSLWAEPNTKPEVARLAPGTEFSVLKGPVCVAARHGHLNAWFVQLPNGITGWISEGYANQEYWIDPLP